jgi:hypothetical protein
MKNYTVKTTDGAEQIMTADGVNTDPDMVSFFLREGDITRRVAWFMKHSIVYIWESPYVESPVTPAKNSRR